MRYVIVDTEVAAAKGIVPALHRRSADGAQMCVAETEVARVARVNGVSLDEMVGTLSGVFKTRSEARLIVSRWNN